MGICSSRNLKRFIRCSKCQQRMRSTRLEKQQFVPESESNLDKQQILKAFYALSDDPAFISRKEFEEIVGPALGPTLWKYLQGEDEKTMSFEQFKRHAEFVKEMRLNTYAEMGMHPNKLMRACLECCGIAPEDECLQDVEFLHNLSEQMGNSSEQVIAWKDKNCPRLFQSLHEHVLNVFLGIPKSVVEESKFDESKVLSRTQMFFLKHNLPRAVFFDTIPENEDGEVRKTLEGRQTAEEVNSESQQRGSWTKLYDSHGQGLAAENFEESIFHFEGSTVAIFQMHSGQIFVLAVDEQWKNNVQPFGGPYTVLFQFQPKFERIEREPPALHCNFRPDCPWGDNSILFNGGLAIKRDFSNIAIVEVWGCARLRKEVVEMPKISEEELEIMEKRKPRREAKAAKKPRKSAVNELSQNPDKQLMEMAGFEFSDNRRRGAQQQK